jgi:hypothetical protein
MTAFFLDGEGDCGRSLPIASLPPNPKKALRLQRHYGTQVIIWNGQLYYG